MARTWPPDWDEQMKGAACPMCANRGLHDSGFGRRFLEGTHADVYLQRAAPLAGYSVAIWKRGHVAEPMDLAADEAAGYWNEVMEAARALKWHYKPAKLNFLTLGNAVPHLHTHVLPRYVDDPAPGKPFPWDLVSGAVPMSEAELSAQVDALRHLLGGPEGR
jgi:diadenosine tetraphosphate (Ap4A) HIT family hydrolase